MDNVTHSLIGLAAGEAVAAYTGKRRLPLWIASALANNLPDLDVILTAAVFRGPLGYLIHHRGHSHSFLLGPALSVLLLLLLFPFYRGRSSVPWGEMTLLALAGPFLHLFADYWNSYGIHPFWPWSARWMYGDFIFIVEPWIWLLFLPALFFAAESRPGKGICLALMALILLLSWFVPYVPLAIALLLNLGALAFFLLYFRLRKRGLRVAVAWGLFFFVLAGFSFAGDRVKKEAGSPAGSELMVQPFPGNPFCWLEMEARMGKEFYEASVSVLAPWPLLVPVNSCPLAARDTTAPLAPGPGDNEKRKWIGRFSAPRTEYEELIKDCRAEIFLRFARIPYWIREKEGWIIGDLRFDREAALGFTEMRLSGQTQSCPDYPFWQGRFHPSSL